jgi:hypothetical protein
MKTSDNQKVPLGGFRGVTKIIDFFNTPEEGFPDVTRRCTALSYHAPDGAKEVFRIY